MKRIVTLILAAGLILGATSAAQAVDFKVSGLWQHRVSFADRNFEKHNGDDKLRAASRLRTQIDVIASESATRTGASPLRARPLARTARK